MKKHHFYIYYMVSILTTTISTIYATQSNKVPKNLSELKEEYKINGISKEILKQMRNEELYDAALELHKKTYLKEISELFFKYGKEIAAIKTNFPITRFFENISLFPNIIASLGYISKEEEKNTINFFEKLSVHTTILPNKMVELVYSILESKARHTLKKILDADTNTTDIIENKLKKIKENSTKNNSHNN